MPASNLKAIAYLTLQPVRSSFSGEVRGFKVSRSTQKPPTVLEDGAVAVKVMLEVPAAVFEPLTPTALIVVPEELVQHEVVVEATE